MVDGFEDVRVHVDILPGIIRRMSSRVVDVAVLLGLGAASLAGRQTAPQSRAMTPDAQWLRASDEWDAGKYTAALEDLRALLKAPAAAEYLERVALLTGELFVTTELTTNGGNPEVSS